MVCVFFKLIRLHLKMPDTVEIWGSFKDELLGFIKARVRHEEDAEDILQDVFVKIHAGLKKVSDIKSLSGWVYQITRNTIIDYYRVKKRPPGELPDEESEYMPEQHAKQFYGCLESHINALPEKYRHAFKRVEIDGISQKKLAHELGISYSGAKSRYQRSKEMLRALFVKCCSIETDKYGNILNANTDHCSC